MSSSDQHSEMDHDMPVSEQRSERANPRPILIALLITFTFMLIEAVGGWLTNSLALLADAGHMLTDVAALALALFAMWLARRPATPERSFGFLRVEVLAAFINAVTLVVLTVFIFVEAFRRVSEPPEVDSVPMLLVAFAGLVANAASAWVLSRGGGHEHNLNTRGAFLHVISDMLGSVGAIAAALIMMATDWYLADPILSAVIGLLILRSAWRLLRESTEVLLEATPQGIDSDRVRDAMCQIDGVVGVHDLHIWTVTSGFIAMSGHVEVSDQRNWHETLVALTELLRERFGIVHVTLQPEEPHGMGDAFQGCSLDTEEGRHACLLAMPQSGDPVAGAHGHRH